MLWWIAALLLLILALDVIVKSTGASPKPPSPADWSGNRQRTGSYPAFGGNVSYLADALGTPPIRSFEWNHCTWSQRELGATNQDLLEYLYSGAALS